MDKLPKHIVDFIEKCTDSHLRLENAGIFDADIEHLCALLQSKPNITSLSLRENNLEDEGALKLMQLLPSTVAKLVVSRNSISDEGAIALMNRIPPFEYLDFSDLRSLITEKTGKFILENPHIQTIVALKRTDIEWDHPELFERINKLMEEKAAQQQESPLPGMRR